MIKLKRNYTSSLLSIAVESHGDKTLYVSTISFYTLYHIWLHSDGTMVDIMYGFVHCTLCGPTSYPTGTKGSLPVCKAAGAWSWPLTSI